MRSGSSMDLGIALQERCPLRAYQDRCPYIPNNESTLPNLDPPFTSRQD